MRTRTERRCWTGWLIRTWAVGAKPLWPTVVLTTTGFVGNCMTGTFWRWLTRAICSRRTILMRTSSRRRRGRCIRMCTTRCCVPSAVIFIAAVLKTAVFGWCIIRVMSNKEAPWSGCVRWRPSSLTVRAGPSAIVWAGSKPALGPGWCAPKWMSTIFASARRCGLRVGSGSACTAKEVPWSESIPEWPMVSWCTAIICAAESQWGWRSPSRRRWCWRRRISLLNATSAVTGAVAGGLSRPRTEPCFWISSKSQRRHICRAWNSARHRNWTSPADIASWICSDRSENRRIWDNWHFRAGLWQQRSSELMPNEEASIMTIVYSDWNCLK